MLEALDAHDPVLADVLPHDVGDRGRDEAKMELDLDPERRSGSEQIEPEWARERLGEKVGWYH